MSAPFVSNPAEDASAQILGATFTVTILALIAVALRLYVRFFMIQNVGWDDSFMTFAMVMTLVGQGLVVAEVNHGAGRHIGDVDPKVYSIGLKLNFITQPLYLISICIVKMAVGFSLLRIASTKFWRRLIISIMVFMAFYTTGCFFTIMFQCTDIRVLWDFTVTATCWGKETLQALSYTNVALNISTDLLFALVIPIPMLWKLNVNQRTRMTLIGILGLGVFASAAAIVKIGFLVNYGLLGDWLWDSRNITIWTIVENNMGIVAGSLPTLRPLFKSFLGSTYGRGSKKRTGGYGTGYGNSSAGAGKSGNRKTGQWEELSSGKHGRKGTQTGDDVDETSSERAFNAVMAKSEEFEMGGLGGRQSKTVIGTGTDPKSSEDSLDKIGLAYPIQGPRKGDPAGITRTTTTTIEISNSR